MAEKLTDNIEKFRQIFNALNDGIIIISLKGELLEANDRILKYFGLSRQDFNSKPAIERWTKKLSKEIPGILNDIEGKEEVLFDIDYIDPQRGKMPVEIRATKIEFNDQPAYLAVARDISTRKKHQKEIYNAAIEAEERERSRVAKELHDGVSPILSTAKLYAQSLKDTNDPEIYETIFRKIEETINDSIQSISEISNNLSPHVLQNFGVEIAIQTILEKTAPIRNLKTEFNYQGPERFAPALETTIYRIVVELLNNTFKHAHASKIFIAIDKTEDNHLTINYRDDGIGFKYNSFGKPTRMGLYNIKNRVISLNGSFDIHTSPNNGFGILVSMPLDE